MRKLLVLILLISCSICIADDGNNKQKDSIQDSLHELSNTLENISRIRQADSLKMLELYQRVQDLNNEETHRRDQILKELQALKQEDSIRQMEQIKKISFLKDKTPGFPVSPFGDTLFLVYTKIGSVKAGERAQLISDKIRKLYQNDIFTIDSLKIIESENTTDLVYEDLIIMSISDFDALWFNKNRRSMALEYLSLMKNAIDKERDNNSLIKILMRIGLSILIIAGIWLLIAFLNKIFLKINILIAQKKDNLFKGIFIKDYQLLTPRMQIQWVRKAIVFFKWFLVALLLYLALPLIFSVFPFTKGWANVLFQWIWQPARDILLSIWHYLPNLFTIIVIFAITRLGIRLFEYVAEEVETGRLEIAGFHSDWASPTLSIIKFLLYVFMFIVIFPYLPGSDSPVFQGVSVFFGVLFSLGSSTAIANIIAGLVITYMRPFKIGDRIKIGEISGDVIEKTLLVTRIRTIKNEYITMPNSSVLSGHTVNYSTSASNTGLIMHSTVTIGYDVPWKKVHEALIEAAYRTVGCMKDPKPFVLQTSLDDFYVSYQINAYTIDVNKLAKTYSDMHENIQDVFNEQGIEILSPHYRAMRDGNMVTIPAEYLPKDYTSPSFNVNVKKDEK